MIHLLRKTTAAVLILLGIYIAAVTFSSHFLLLKDLPDYDHMPELRTLFSQGQYEKAYRLGMDLKKSNWYNDKKELDHFIAASAEHNNSFSKSSFNFLRGFFSGSYDGISDSAGAILSDLLIFGDVRDIFIQTGLIAMGKENDKVILAISGTGLLLEVLPVANWFPAALKYLHKSSALSEEFTNRLVKIITNFKEYGKLSKSERTLFLKIYNLFLRSGLYRTGETMKFVKTPQQLSMAAKLADKYPENLYLAVKAADGKILDSGLRFSDKKLFEAARKGTAGIMTLKRYKTLAAVKIISTGRLGAFIRNTARKNNILRSSFYALSAVLIFSGFFLLSLRRQKKLKNN